MSTTGKIGKDPFCRNCNQFIVMGDIKHSGHLIDYRYPNLVECSECEKEVAPVNVINNEIGEVRCLDCQKLRISDNNCICDNERECAYHMREKARDLQNSDKICKECGKHMPPIATLDNCRTCADKLDLQISDTYELSDKLQMGNFTMLPNLDWKCDLCFETMVKDERLSHICESDDDKIIRKKHYGIDIDYEWALLGACFYAAWYNGNIDWQLKYIWNNNTDNKEKVTCKRCIGMLKTDLRSLDLL